MDKITAFQTSDGIIHPTYFAAKEHANRRYGDLLTQNTHLALKHTKYVEMMDFIDTHIESFYKLKLLKDDIKLTKEVDE